MQNSQQIVLAPIDWGIIIVYLLYLARVIFTSIRKGGSKNDSDYILAGRRLTLPAFVATLVSTWYGGILGVGEFTYQYGISNWVVLGLPYYLFAIIFALFFAEKIRKTNLLTLPDQFHHYYGKKAGVFSGILLFIATLPAPYLLMLGFLINILTGISLWLSIILGSLFSLLYIFSGGFKAIVRTDKIQFLLMFTGFIIAFIILNLWEFPFWHLPEVLPESYFSFTGGNSFAYIFAWYIIASQTLIDPNFYQRCYAAKSPAIARRGILVSIVFWFIFDFLTTMTGLYARAVLPDLESGILAFPLLGSIYLPVVFKGLFFTGILATIMSTVDSFSFVSAISLGRDAVGRLRHDKSIFSRYLIQWALIVVIITSIIISWFEKSVISLWYQLGSITIPSLLLPLLVRRFITKRLDNNMVLAGMVTSSVVTLGLFAFPGWLTAIAAESIFIPDQPIYVGIILNGIFLLGAYLMKK